MFIWVAILVFLIAVYVFSRPLRERHLYPAGPTPWPIFGNLWLIKGSKNMLYEDAKTLWEKYGEEHAVTLWLGTRPHVIIHTVEGARQAFVEDRWGFASRPDQGNFRYIYNEDGELNISMEENSGKWLSKRKVATKIMRQIANPNRLEKAVNRATEMVAEALKKAEGAISLQPYTDTCVYVILADLCFSGNLSLHDSKLQEVIQAKLQNKRYPASLLLTFMIPGVTKCLWLLEALVPRWRRAMRFVRFQYDVVRSYIASHEQTANHRCNGTAAPEIRDMVDAIQQEQGESGISDSAAMMVISDIFLAGANGIAKTLQWFVLEMSLNPDVQERCAEEIRSILDDGQTPVLADRAKLPLLEASIMESLRIHPGDGLAMFHAPTEAGNSLFGKYALSKDTVLTYNVWAIQRSPDAFSEPEKFNPSRFIQGDGVVAPRNWIPFGIGVRSCVGKNLARDATFLICARLLRQFRFKTHDGYSYTTRPEMKNGFTHTITPGQKFVVEAR